MTTPLQFEVPGAPTEAPPLEVAPQPEKPIASGLATVSETPESRSGVVCKDMIPPSELAKVQAEAAKLLPEMLNNTQVLMNHGQSALQGVNGLIDRLMRELPANDTGFVRDIMRELTLTSKSLKGRYDLNTPEGKKSYDEWESSFVKKWFRKGRNYVQAMLVDMQSVDTQLEKILKDLNQHKMQAMRNIAYLDQLYGENEVAIFQLISAIAVMECIAEQARQQVATIPPDDPTTGNKNAELKQRYADLILQMDVKIGEYKGRLWVAWATSPQVRMMRVLNVGMAEKLNEAVGLTIPTMKLAIVQWRMMAESLEAAKANEAVSSATNDMLQQVAANSAQAAGQIMRAVQTPTLLPETITAVTDSLVQMAENILTEVEEGSRKRAELDATMGQSKLILDGSSAHYNEQVVNSIVGSSRQILALPAGPSAG